MLNIFILCLKFIRPYKKSDTVNKHAAFEPIKSDADNNEKKKSKKRDQLLFINVIIVISCS
jgi:hypothetical protein